MNSRENRRKQHRKNYNIQPSAAPKPPELAYARPKTTSTKKKKTKWKFLSKTAPGLESPNLPLPPALSRKFSLEPPSPAPSQATPPGLWQTYDRMDLRKRFTRPAPGRFRTVAVLLLFAGLGAGYWHAEGKTTPGRLPSGRTRYVQAVEPVPKCRV